MEGKPPTTTEPEKVSTELEAISLEATVRGVLGGAGEYLRGTETIVTDEVGGDGNSGATIDEVREIRDEIRGLREELTND